MRKTPDKDIVTAEVVEVPRPDYWIGVSVQNGVVHLWSNCPRDSREQMINDFDGTRTPQFIVRLPGTQPQPAAPEADAEIDRMIYELSAAQGFAADGQKGAACVAIAGVMERLAKIRGGR